LRITLPDGLSQFIFQIFKSNAPRVNVFQFPAKHDPYFRARPKVIGPEGQEFTHFVQRKPQILQAPNELQGGKVIAGVKSKTTLAARGRRKQPIPFVESDGIDA
jgi:hypothetical protein